MRPNILKPCALATLLLVGQPPVLAGQDALGDQLGTLARENGFSIEGLDRLDAEAGRAAEGNPAARLKTLLQGYNYIVVESRPGQIERVVITGPAHSGRKTPPSSTIQTTRLGDHHEVQALLVGPNGLPQTVTLLVDTGASTVVLPSSMIAALGFDAGQLEPGISQTASGQVQVKMGELGSVIVGPVSADNVRVSFFPDKRLNGAMLLGMSFLNRFRITIDDERNEIVLLAK